MKTVVELAKSVREMRDRQRTYFSLRRKKAPQEQCEAACFASRDAERLVDKMVEAIEHEATERQEGLFG